MKYVFVLSLLLTIISCNEQEVSPTNNKTSGLVSSGTSSSLDDYRSLYSFAVATGVSIEDIAGIGIASNDYCYVWYKDGTASYGTSDDLDSYRASYTYSLAPEKNISQILGMGIASNDHCYVWYR